MMYICNNSENCNRPNCPHRTPHTKDRLCGEFKCASTGIVVICVEYVKVVKEKKEKSMNINHYNPETGLSIRSERIPVGTYFYGKIPLYTGSDKHLFLKTDTNIIDVDQPRNEWENDVYVYDYRPMKVTINVDGPVAN